MARIRAHNFAISLDGFGSGEGQSLETPFGHAGTRLMEWFFPTASFQEQTGNRERVEVDPASEADDRYARKSWEGIGAEIMGANKFGPPGWHDDPNWRGWWGENPPFHTPVFVLTNHPRSSIEMEGGTTFHFMTASPEEAARVALDAANGLDVRHGGGASSLRDFLAAGLIDHLHVVQVPIVLGRGSRLWDDLESLEENHTVTLETTPSGVTHISFSRK